MSIGLTDTFGALSDPTRLRALRMLLEMELSVSELQEALGVAQSTASALLRVLMNAGLVDFRRESRRAWYRANELPPWMREAMGGEALSAADRQALERIREARLGNDAATGAFDRYVPGRSWKSLARSLLMLMDVDVIADLGVGPGDLTLLLAPSARRLYAVDREPASLQRLEERAAASGIENITAVPSALEDVTLPERADLVVLSLVLHYSEDPARILARARELLKPGGRVWIAELATHDHTWVRDRLGHRRLGFSGDELSQLLEEGGFTDIAVAPGATDKRPPRFDTWIAVGRTAEDKT